jgi:hypothetical protein
VRAPGDRRPMNLTTRQVLYAALAAIGLFATWYFNLRFMAESGGSFSAMDFIRAGYASNASSSVTNDLLVGVAAFLIWSYAEARHLGMRHWWVYVVLTFGMAFACAFPAFLFARERRLQALAPSGSLP